MSQYELAKFASDVEKAFALVGGEKSKGIYDWMLFQFEQQSVQQHHNNLPNTVQLSNALC